MTNSEKAHIRALERGIDLIDVAAKEIKINYPEGAAKTLVLLKALLLMETGKPTEAKKLLEKE